MVVTQHAKLLQHLAKNNMARSHELANIGVSATTISRAVAAKQIIRIGRGLYQHADADVDANAALVEVSKRAPNAVICLTSILAFHELTDQLPRKTWIAIGAKDWRPTIKYPPIRTVQFREPYFSGDIETHVISGIDVRMYTIPKTLADAFRNPKLVDRSVAVESLRNAIEMRRTTPAAIAETAKVYRAWNRMKPYLEALTSHG